MDVLLINLNLCTFDTLLAAILYVINGQEII